MLFLSLLKREYGKFFGLNHKLLYLTNLSHPSMQFDTAYHQSLTGQGIKLNINYKPFLESPVFKLHFYKKLTTYCVA